MEGGVIMDAFEKIRRVYDALRSDLYSLVGPDAYPNSETVDVICAVLMHMDNAMDELERGYRNVIPSEVEQMTPAQIFLDILMEVGEDERAD